MRIFQILNPKHVSLRGAAQFETISNTKIQMFKTNYGYCVLILDIRILNLFRISDSDIRIYIQSYE